jgi:hypothetical protein
MIDRHVEITAYKILIQSRYIEAVNIIKPNDISNGKSLVISLSSYIFPHVTLPLLRRDIILSHNSSLGNFHLPADSAAIVANPVFCESGAHAFELNVLN